MPRVVDKVVKRKDIAKSTCNLFIQEGFVNISISQIAKVAGIGKGTFYEYFKNKEDIVFELMSCLQEDYDPKLKSNLNDTKDTKEKVAYLFNIFLDDDETIQIQRKIYKEFLAIYLSNPSKEIIEYHQTLKNKYFLVLSDILNDAIKNKEISKLALEFIPSLFATAEGFLITSEDSRKDILDYLDNLFLLLERNN